MHVLQTLSEPMPKDLALVPTMGALHEGHLSLIKEAKKHARNVMVSIFVNPTQFAPNEDFDRYPRSVEADTRACELAGVDFLWIPSAEEIYPEGLGAVEKITMPEALTQTLCGVTRPHFFDGVATVVHRLLSLTKPKVAVFGEKDFQQLVMIKQLVKDYGLDTKIIGAPIIRESDGLAMSSRNQYLSSEERQYAPQLYQALLDCRKQVKDQELPMEILVEIAQKRCKNLELEYCQSVNAKTLQKTNPAQAGHRLLIAARLGGTRLIDSISL